MPIYFTFLYNLVNFVGINIPLLSPTRPFSSVHLQIAFAYFQDRIHIAATIDVRRYSLATISQRAHLNEERYYEDWQKIFFEMGHIYNKTDGHAEKSLPSYTFARQWLQHHGYDLGSKQKRFEGGQKKTVWWVTKPED